MNIFFIRNIILVTLVGLHFFSGCNTIDREKDIAPNTVIPSPQQVKYQQMEMIGFIHFTINTFTDKEWGYGDESPLLFNPTQLDVEQWVKTAKAGGLKQLILTAKHHDGFCLWPSKYTEHSVKNSSYKNGKGDIVKEFVEACKKHGLKAGLYLSPWDRNHKDYATPEYITYYRNQLKELLTEYGEINEIWFDGANGGDGYYGGANESRKIDRKTYYDWDNTFEMIKKWQPDIKIFSDAGPDIHWIGNEKGFAGITFWSTIMKDRQVIGASKTDYLNTGDPNGDAWIIGQCDVSIRPGWFYHSVQDKRVKTPQELMDIYYKSVGRNAVLLINLPPDKRGLIHDNDIRSLAGFKQILDKTFDQNLINEATCSSNNKNDGWYFTADKAIDDNPESYWAASDTLQTPELIIDLQEGEEFDRILLQEPIRLGQRISQFRILVFKDGTWKMIHQGTTIGYKRLVRINPIIASKVKIEILKANNRAAISNIGLFKASDKEGFNHVFTNLFSAETDSTVACYRIPSLVTVPNGNLLAVIDQRAPSCDDLKWNKNINIVMRRSSDNGNSWSGIETIVDYPDGQSASDPSMIVDKVTKEIFLFFNFIDHGQEKDVYYLKVMKSKDNGVSWSSPEDITSQITKPEWHRDFKFITSGRGIQTSNGKLVHTIVNLNNGLHLFASNNHGKSWHLIDTPILPGDESKVVELTNGRWMINSRLNGTGYRQIHVSSDEGKTWASRPDSNLVDPGCNASIINYTLPSDKKVLFFSNANDKESRRNMSIRISYDNGKTWTDGKTLYPGGSAYSSMTVLADGDIGLLFERDDYKQNTFVRLSPGWLLNE
ncbi:MAG: alpha-L-fucosidase [Bacteroidota bacterium]